MHIWLWIGLLILLMAMVCNVWWLKDNTKESEWIYALKYSIILAIEILFTFAVNAIVLTQR